MSKRTQIGLALMIVSAAGCISCGRSPEVSAAAPPTVTPVHVVASSVPAREPSVPERGLTQFVTSGPIVVENQVELEAQRDGVVAAIEADTGKHVRRGELLARLDDRQLQAELAEHQADLRATEANHKRWEAQAMVAQADLDRAQAMFEANLITREQLDHARYARKAAGYEAEREGENLSFYRAKVLESELEIEKTRITAPFDGVVARRYIRVGEKVAPNERMFWISAVSPLNVRFTLPQEFVGRIHPGTAISVDGPMNQAHLARITSVSPVVDPGSGTIEVQARIEGKTPDLRPGMTVNIRVDTAQ